jgi:hypothetical protein
MVKRLVLFVSMVLVVSLLMTSAALAATPQDIYDDYADNGKLDGTYSQAELQAYLNDATVHQYGDPSIIDSLDRLVTDLLKGRESFPFTGFQLMIAGIVVVALVGGGIALRRLSRPRES